MIGVADMRAYSIILKLINTLISSVVVISLCISGFYAGYALWDNNLVYAAVDDVQADMLRLKPVVEDGLPSFEELLKINPDIVAWVTIDNTNMDYPIVQGETNLSYINKDIYGEFALAGSIFLDSRNDRDFKDNYSLLYGHSMNRSKMFGDLELYKDEDFFKENQTGTLLTLEGVYNLKIFASLLVPANEDEIFNPTLWHDDIEDIINYAEAEALYLNKATLASMRAMEGDLQVLALTTCSHEFTDARTVVLAVMEPN